MGRRPGPDRRDEACLRWEGQRVGAGAGTRGQCEGRAAVTVGLDAAVRSSRRGHDRECRRGVLRQRHPPRLGRRRVRHAAARLTRAQAEQGDARLHIVRRRRRSVRTRLARRELVRHDERHLLDAEPQGVRRPAQARPRIPGARRAPDGRRGGHRAACPRSGWRLSGGRRVRRAAGTRAPGRRATGAR